jgi:hypothetical protein
MDLGLILAIAGTTITILGFIYGFLRNFKNDINSHLDRLEKRIDKSDDRFDRHAQRIDQLYVMFNASLTELKNMHGRVCVLEERTRK